MASAGLALRCARPAEAGLSYGAGARPASIQLYHDERPQPPEALRLIVVGDILLGRGAAGRRDVFERVAPALAGADIAAGNLEGLLSSDPINHQAGSAASGYALAAPPRAAAWLQSAGFDILGIANNHAGDAGDEARRSTAGQLATAGLRVVGTDSGDFQVVQVRGVRLAFLAFNAVQVPGRDDLVWKRAQALAAIRRAAESAQAVVVLMHWGSEYEALAGLRQQEAARALAEAGADLIVGSHPHVVQGTEVIECSDGRRAFAAYSLGNFVFDQRAGAETQSGAALEAVFTADGLAGVAARAVWAGPQPHWLNDGQESGVFQRLLPEPKHLRAACSDDVCSLARIEKGARGTGPIVRDEIDLTGDGQNELIVQRGGRALIYQAGALAWQSPVAWEVHDVTVGDPNDDGRFEALLALRKADKSGTIRSHPFIIGYRGGRYHEVWGGSAVADPLAEIELADINADGIDEMIAIEERCASAVETDRNGGCDRKVVSIWRWNGWGFSQMWKSRPGNFQAIQLYQQAGGEPAVVIDELWSLNAVLDD